MDDLDIYQRSRARARRRATFRLRRQERRLLARLARTRRPDAGELARLAAVRSVLRARDPGRPAGWSRTVRYRSTAVGRPAG